MPDAIPLRGAVKKTLRIKCVDCFMYPKYICGQLVFAKVRIKPGYRIWISRLLEGDGNCFVWEIGGEFVVAWLGIFGRVLSAKYANMSPQVSTHPQPPGFLLPHSIW